MQQDLVQQFSPSSGEGFAYWIELYRLVNKSDYPLPRADSGMLHIASRLNLQGNLRVLLEKGVQINKEDDRGNTALIYAAEWGHQDIFRTLLKSNADVNKEQGEL